MKASKYLTAGASSGSSAPRLGFLDLPPETQKEIFTWIRTKELLNLQRVSRYFHSLASARLYGHLNFVLTHADAQSYYSKPNTRLADVLHTFATSEHDYSQYLKVFCLELSDRDGEDVKQRILSKYHFEEEATKLLNTTLLLMLRKANMLETFYWDPAIELSGFVYQALSKTPTLRGLHLRLETCAVPRTASIPASTNPVAHAGAQQGTLGFPAHTPLYAAAYSSATSSASSILMRSKKANPHIATPGKRKFPAFQNLRELDVVGIDNLGENLTEIAACLLSCSTTLKSLTLSLSQDLARRARRVPPPVATMNAAVDVDMDEDDDDMTPPPPESPPLTTLTNDADIRKEKAAQESVLAILLGLEPANVRDKKIDKILKASASTLKSKEDVNQVFMGELRKVMTKLIQTKSSAYGGLAKDKHVLELLEKAAEKYLQSDGTKLKKASPQANYAPKVPAESSHNASAPASLTYPVPVGLYQEFEEFLSTNPTSYDDFDKYVHAKTGGSWDPQHSSPSNALQALYDSSSSYKPSSYTQGSGSQVYASYPSSDAFFQSIFPTYSGSSPNGSKVSAQMKQEMVDKEAFKQFHPNGTLLSPKPEPAYSDESDSDDEVVTTEEQPGFGTAKVFDATEKVPGDVEDVMDVDMEHPDVVESEDDDVDQENMEDSYEMSAAEMNGAVASIEHDPAEGSAAGIRTTHATNDINLPQADKNTPSQQRKSGKEKTRRSAATTEETMQEYIRTKHGFHLEELYLYLIPIKASTMARGLDLSCLKQLTLLNVGPQAGFWTLLDKIQKESEPLKLQYLHTDDVSLAFLNCVANLNKVTDLFLMKRNSKEADSSNSKPYAPLVDIRLLALRKHIGTLKRLMIMNNDDESWDLDSKTMRLLTVKGEGLVELAMSSGIDDYHILMQNLRGLKSLVALHVLAIRITDQCQSVTRECRKFTIDTLNYCPELKIKYLVMSGMVCQLARRPRSFNKAPIVKVDIKGKGKEKAPAVSSPQEQHTSKWNPVLAPNSAVEENFDEIESGGLEMAVVKHLKFGDVYDVKIFNKHIRTGKF